MRGTAKENVRREALRLSAVGLIGFILIDFISFVLIPHPYAFTFTEFYVGYQPWITIIYAMIFISLLLVLVGMKKQVKFANANIP